VSLDNFHIWWIFQQYFVFALDIFSNVHNLEENFCEHRSHHSRVFPGQAAANKQTSKKLGGGEENKSKIIMANIIMHHAGAEVFNTVTYLEVTHSVIKGY
jgi:hypothetical protein